MEEEFEKIRNWVENKLDSFSHLIEFTIGKSKDCEERFKTYYQPKGYSNYIVLAYGEPKNIDQGEEFLIGYFRKHPKWKEKNANEREGGGGNNKASNLYLAVKYEVKEFDELFDELLQEEWTPIDLDR